MECSEGSSFEDRTGESLSGDTMLDSISLMLESVTLACDDDDDDDFFLVSSSSLGAAFEGNGAGNDDCYRFKF